VARKRLTDITTTYTLANVSGGESYSFLGDTNLQLACLCGVKRDIDRGLDLIWEAATGPDQVLRALFELGYLLEVGVEGRIPNAAEFYEAIALRRPRDADLECDLRFCQNAQDGQQRLSWQRQRP
jgi:hypothetical protein